MKPFKIFGFENHPFHDFKIVKAENMDEVFRKYRKVYGYFTAAQVVEDK